MLDSAYKAGIDKSVVTLDDQPLEDAVKDGPRDSTNSICGLFTCVNTVVNNFTEEDYCLLLTCLSLGDPLGADLDPRFAESLDHLRPVDPEGERGLAGKRVGAHLKQHNCHSHGSTLLLTSSHSA